MDRQCTPGPWRLVCPGASKVPDVIGATDWCVAEFVENPADARLIAAAPDLLAALQTMVRHMDPLGEDAVPMWTAARAAIALATNTPSPQPKVPPLTSGDPAPLSAATDSPGAGGADLCPGCGLPIHGGEQ
jgi:hypothetical protein